LISLSWLLMAVVPAVALDSGWVNRAWQLEDGLPDSYVSGIAQTSDGYLWVGTLGGLVRFDGVRFHEERLDLESQTVQSMFVDRRDRLWLAMDRGPVVCLGEGEYHVYTVADGLPNVQLRRLIEDGDGAIWIASLSAQISRIKNGQVTTFGEESGVPGEGGGALAFDEAGRLWLCKEGILRLFQNGRFVDQGRVNDNNAVIGAAHAGGIWVWAKSQLFKCDSEHGLTKLADVAPESTIIPKVMLEDHTGAVWLGTVADGLFRYDGLRCEHISTSHPEITCLSEDREGNIWAGTAGGGLNRVRPRILELRGRESGLPFESVASICEDGTGALWIATQNGMLARQLGGKLICLSQTNGWKDAHATCVASDQKGTVWVGTSDAGLYCCRNGAFVVSHGEDGLGNKPVRCLLPASNGDLWLATFSPTCLERLHGQKWQTFKLPEGVYAIRAMAEDTYGTVWLGSSDGKLMRADAAKGTVAVQREGDSIRCLWSTPDGSVWVGHAHTGIGLLKAGRYSVISSQEGLFENAISQILPDGHGWMWLAGTRGVFRVREEELQDVAAGRAPRLLSVAYGHGEGLANLQANFDFYPGAARSRDGRLWFPMRTGLLGVHPENIHGEQKPPPVLLEQVIVDGRPVAQWQHRPPEQKADKLVDLRLPGAAVKLGPKHHELEFKYTALSFIAPDQIVFRYRLEGVDETWVEAQGRRSAVYSRLLPGTYVFHSATCNDVGVWNEAAPLAITVAPFFWQTWWFRLISVTGFACVVGFSVRIWSNRRLRRRLAFLVQQQALERERARIARDLHDDLGASLTQIGFAMEELKETVSPAEEMKRQTVLLGDRVHALARDLDAVVWTVNPRNDSLTELVSYLSQYFLEGFRPTPIRTRLEVDDEFPHLSLSPDARHHLFLVAKEAMNNVMKHSGATEVRLKLSTSDGVFEFRLEDNGRGFSVDSALASKRHGLRNMQTRIKEVGGDITVLSIPAKETSIVVRVPLANNDKL